MGNEWYRESLPCIIHTPICVVPDIVDSFGFRKGQALQFNWLYEKGAFVFHKDSTFSVDFAKVSIQIYMRTIWFIISYRNSPESFIPHLKIEGAVESLSHEILTIQGKGDKNAATLLLNKYCTITGPLKTALENLESVKVRTVSLNRIIKPRELSWDFHIE